MPVGTDPASEKRSFALTSDSDQRAKRFRNGAIIKAILDNLRDVHILFSLDGAQVRYANKATTAVFGFSAEELQKCPQLRFDCIHQLHRDQVVEYFDSVIHHRTPFRTEYVIYRVDGVQVRVEEDSRIVKTSEGEELILTTIRSECVTEVYTRHQHLKAQHTVANILSSAKASDSAILSTLEAIGKELGWQICEHWIPVEGSPQLRISQIWCAENLKSTDEFVAITRTLQLDRAQMTQGKVWTGGLPLWTATVVDSDPIERRKATAKLGLKTSLSFPISDGTVDGGIFTLYSIESYSIDTDLLQTVSGIGIQIAQYLQRTRLTESHAAGERRFRQLFEKNEAVKLVIDPANGTIIDANPAAASFYGYSVEQLRSLKVWDINTLPEIEVRDLMRTASGEQRNRFIFDHRLSSGEVRQVEVHSSPLSLDGRDYLYSTIFDITDKLRTEAALRESDERFRLVFKHTPTAIAIFDKQMRYLFATTAWLEEYRLRDQGVIGHSQFEFFPETSERWRDIYRHAMAGETVESTEERIIRADGTVGWIRFIVSPWRTSQDSIGGIIVFTESITSEKISHDALRESEEKYRSLFENLIDGFALHKIVLDPSGNPIDYIFLEVNSVFEEMTGLKRENLIGRCVTEVIPGIESAKENWIGKYGRVALNGETVKFESETPELGRWFWISAYSPREGYFVTVFEDITARKLAEAKLRDQQRSVSALLGNLPGMAYRCQNTPDWPMEFVSEGCRQLTGYTPSEMQIGGSVQYNDLIHPDDRTMVWNEVQRGIERRESYRLTYRLITRNGEIKFVWEQGSAVVDEENRVVALEGFIADISEQKHAEEALQSREEHFRALIDNSSDVITLFDINGQFIYLSPSVERVLGYSADELKGTSIFRRLHRDDCRRVREIMRRALIKGGDVSAELRIRHKDGSWRILDTIGRNCLMIRMSAL
ncbi:MAG: PAS domain S-box protein [bacterium]|nr:PAS domain S-box protein [bacterium]